MSKKLSVFSVAVAFALSLPGADVTVPSSYDEASDSWVGDVVSLTNAILQAEPYQKIYLSKGVYDITFMTNAPMYAADGKGYGAALLRTVNNGVRLIGATGDPKDVVIKAVNPRVRLMSLNNFLSGVHDMTFTGGESIADNVETWAYRCGGGVLLAATDTVVSNCVFYNNMASTRGGAVSGPNGLLGKVYDSLFYENNYTPYALVAANTELHNCIVSNNVALHEQSDRWISSAAESCRSYNTVFIFNRGNLTGGVNGGVAVGCRFLFNRQNNEHGNNYGNPGGGAAYGATLSNCYFYGNAAYRLGGAVRGGSVIGCTVVSNTTLNVTDCCGGGIYKADFVVGCTVASNFCRQGGGLYGCTNVVDTEISYNKAKRGGGAYESILTGCTIAHNVADDFANGNYNGFGAGIAFGAATNCVFRDNSCSAAFGTKSLVGCDIADTSMHAYHIESCVIHNVKNAEMVRAVGNVAYPEGHVSSNIYMFGGVELMRNCLITNCTWWSIPGSYVNSSAFDPGGAENIAARIENCTFMDNNFYLLTRNFDKPTQTIAFINSVIHSTRPGDRPDIVVKAKCTVLTNCVYRTCSITQEEGFENAGCTEIENPADLKLLREGPHPYSIKRSSPLRGGGLPLDWMTDGVDIVGNPRLREGQVDIGAYQCWLDPDGTYLIVR